MIVFFLKKYIMENENNFQIGGAMSYNTKQRELIMECLKNNLDKCITVEQIEKYLIERNLKVGIVTIYRYLDKLNKEGLVNKYISEKGNQTSYQYLDNDHCNNHFHLKCTNCGKIIHLDCNEINCHIKEEHNFDVDNSKTIIYGKCINCKKEGTK